MSEEIIPHPTIRSRFEPPRGLDGLPDEILSNIYQEYFLETKLTLYHPDIATVPSSWLLNKRHGAIARQAALEHATITIYSGYQVVRLLNQPETVPVLSTVELQIPSGDTWISLPLMDDLFRELSSRVKVNILLSCRHPVCELENMEMTESHWLKDAVDKDATWTHEILEEAIDNSDSYHWLGNIVKDEVFGGLSCRPTISLEVSLSLQPMLRDLQLRYDINTKTLSATSGQEIIRAVQDLGGLSRLKSSGARGTLCSRPEVDSTLKDTMQKWLLARLFDIEEQVRFAEYEQWTDCPPDQLALKLGEEAAFALEIMDKESALEIMIKEKVRISPEICLNIIEWQKKGKRPTVEFKTEEGARKIALTMFYERKPRVDLRLNWFPASAGWYHRELDFFDHYKFIAQFVEGQPGYRLIDGICYDYLYKELDAGGE